METLFDVAPAAVNGYTTSRADTSAYGALAEHLAITELLRRGHKVAVPVVDDDGVDLVVNYSVRVQVKNAHRRPAEVQPGYVYDKFSWASKRGWVAADVFLLHGQDGIKSRWWVVPASELLGHGNSLVLYVSGAGKRQARVAAYEDAWSVFGG